MYLKNFLYGLIIGVGFIIPGVSGGVIATILGIYDIIIYKLNNLFKNFKNNILYLAPLFAGIILSVLFFSKLILYLLNEHLHFISYVFIGLILGSLPYIFKEIKEKTNKKISYLWFSFTLLIGIIMFLIERNTINSDINPNTLIMIIAGFMYSIGKLVPGISGASLLMLLGIYEYLLTFLANPLNISFNVLLTFIPFLISFFISSIFIIKLMNYLFRNHFRSTYSAIIGFVISSCLFIYPNYFSIISMIIIILAFLISYNLSK